MERFSAIVENGRLYHSLKSDAEVRGSRDPNSTLRWEEVAVIVCGWHPLAILSLSLFIWIFSFATVFFSLNGDGLDAASQSESLFVEDLPSISQQSTHPNP